MECLRMITKVIVSDEPSKLALLAPFRISVAMNDRVVAAARRRGIKRPDWIRQAISAELERDEAAVAARGIISPEQAVLLELCAAARQRGIDPKQALTDALEADIAAAAKPAV